jgi:hypothetical protein
MATKGQPKDQLAAAADSSNLDSLLAELEAARAALAPQIRGMTSLSNDSLSSELLTQINQEIVDLQRRDGLLAAAIAALEALVADGYPDVPAATLPGNLFEELSGDVSDITAGASVFVPAPLATTIDVTLQPFTNKE